MNHSHDHMQWHNQQAWSSKPASDDRLISSSGSGLFSSSDKTEKSLFAEQKAKLFYESKSFISSNSSHFHHMCFISGKETNNQLGQQ